MNNWILFSLILGGIITWAAIAITLLRITLGHTHPEKERGEG